MPARKTESRLPDGFTASDLGESAQAQENNAAIVSFIRSPLVMARPNTYVIFITDAAIAAATANYEWVFSENGAVTATQTTPAGEFTYTPQSLGALSISIKIKGADNADKATITLNQEVVTLNEELEALITSAVNNPGPGVGNVEVARELINDHNPYYQAVTLQDPEPGDGFKRFVFSMASEGILQRNAEQRKVLTDALAAALNNGSGDFATLAVEGAGICRIRLALAAMVVAGLPWTELPDAASARASADQQLREQLGTLDENKKIDLFNLVRFPKSNITLCGKILEALRNRYFAGANFNDVLTGMNGTRAHWINRHYKEGPLVTA
ncbi:MAG: hypothetical protein KF862_00755 [Chitinophagaceae bacterium]|nr:hypothetical protein [Chitinophagaceae bacterium]